MKVFYLFQSMNQDINNRIESLGYEIINSTAEADLIVYQSIIDDVFLELTDIQNCRVILSEEDFLTREDPFVKTIVDSEKELSVCFENENVGEVSKTVKSLVSELMEESHFEDQERYLTMVGIELVQNALIYKRSNNRSGSVSFKINRGRENYQLVIEDSFGGLTQDIFTKNLRRALREKTPESKKTGAGLGFSMVVSASDELIFNIDSGKKTEVCCIMNKYKRLREYKLKRPSIYFVGDRN